MENQKENNSTEKVKKKPFKQTRELIKLALNNGYTQTKIAKLCRTQQSIVSAWSKGEKLGAEQQLKPLLDLFGHKLRRNSFKLYWFKDPETAEIQFMRVEGQVIFNLVIGNNDNYKTFIPKHKLIIHYQGGDNVFLIFQNKCKHYDDKNLDSVTWESMFFDKKNIIDVVVFFDNLNQVYIKLDKLRNYLREHNVYDVSSLDEEGKEWYDNTVKTILHESNLNIQEYLNLWENLIKNFPHYVESLPFLIRQALLNHGLQVKNIIEYPKSW